MMNDKRVQGHTELVKRKNAVVNTDRSAYLAAKKRREREVMLDEIIEKTKILDERFSVLDDKLSKILNLLEGK